MLDKTRNLTNRARLSLSILFTSTLPLAAQIPAFPGAEGYGAYAKGGRGGDVYHVTNLNASGAGSFIEGISTVPSAGRTIVFDVSGYIRFPSGSGGTRMTASKVTIAGQTAPGDGIGFYNNAFRISGDDVIVRHVRFRLGKYGTGGDCVNLDSGSINSMLDHLSVQFSTDENISSYNSPPENVTLQYSLNAWGLESHSCGGLWDQDHATSHHNLWAHNHTRNPKARPNGLLEWINNVTFDWDIGFIMGDSQSNQNWKSNVLNNYFLCPPGNTRSKALQKGTVGTNGKPNFTVFLSGNLSDYDGDGLLNGTDKGYAIVEGTAHAPGTSGLTPGATGYYQSATAIAGSTAGVTTDGALLAYKKVASNAGALRLDANYSGTLRDEVDTILINKLQTQTKFHISRESDTGASNAGFGFLTSTPAPIDSDRDGMPDSYESALGWNPGVQDNNTTVSGTTFFPTGYSTSYTRLEEYLYFKSIPHMLITKATATSPDIDLSRYTQGFTNNPVFTISSITGGSATQSGTGGKLVHFASNNAAGRGGFKFTVTDDDGSVWTQQFAICVLSTSAPVDLSWRGTGSNWDSSSSNWLKDGAPSTFSGGDRVTFDNSGSAAPTVNIPSPVLATTVDVNSSSDYTFSGAGAISGIHALTKRGSGKLTINNSTANTFEGVSLEQGTLAINTAGGVGSATISCLGGSLSLGPPSNSTIGAPLEFLSPTTITPTSQHSEGGNWTGTNQTVTLTGGSVLWTVAGDWTGFSGRLDFGNGSTKVRLNGNSNINFGSTAVAVDLGSNNAQLMNRNGATIQFGSLEATGSNTALYGTQTGSTPSTYSIGALNTDTTFAGAIHDGGGGTNIIKTGTGNWTLTGTSDHTGSTTVSQGRLTLNGSLASSAVTVASGTTLSGSGNVGGLTTASSGGTISPGEGIGSVGTLTAAAGLSLNGGSTVDLDLSDSLAGPNDRITVSTGNLTLSSPVNFNVHMADGMLQNGTYYLIDGSATQVGSGITMNLSGIPAGTRQTFGLNRQANGSSPAFVVLNVGGTPAASLVWTGTNGGGAWDLNTTGNFSGGPTATFYNLDAVTFNDTSSVGTVVLGGTVEPRLVTVSNSSSKPYTFSGTGEIGGNAQLLKTGTGTLTLESANSYTGGTSIGAGSTIQLANDAANAGALGPGPVTFLGGTLSMYRNNSSYNSATYQLVVPAGQTGTFNADDRCDLYGSLTGDGTLNYRIPWVRSALFGDWSAFTGRINAVAYTGYGEFRIASSYSPPGFPAATVDLGAGMVMMHTGILSKGAGTTISIGALSGSAGSKLLGGVTPGRALTYRIGGKGVDASFSGNILEQVPGTTLTNIIKTGSGTWTLSGTGAWAGGTGVEQGTLAITGDISSAGAVIVSDGATLQLTGGSLASDAVNVDSGATFSGYGALVSDLIVNGVLEGRGVSSGTAGSLALDGSLFLGDAATARMRGGLSSDLLNVTNDINLAGTMQISLTPGTEFGRYTLITYAGNHTGSLSLTGIPGGTTAHLSTTIAGQIDLVIDDSDEDGLPDSWEMQYFLNLASGPTDDNDGDGQNNAMELMTGTNPSSGVSLFAVSITPSGGSLFNLTWPSVPGKFYRIESSGTLSGTWNPVITVPAEDSPATSTVHQIDISTHPGKWFYRVALDP